MSLSLASIHVYPVKSLGGFSVDSARLTDRGLEHDRRWMLVDGDGRFLSQRELPMMACLHCSPGRNGFRTTDTRDGAWLDIPWSIDDEAVEPVVIWDDRVLAIAAPSAMSEWFSARLSSVVRLVYMPDRSMRTVDRNYAEGITSFSDGFPFLVISQASLDDLNTRLGPDDRVAMDRFRPNLVIAGSLAFEEDGWRSIKIGAARFELVKPCARCVIPTTDQRTGARGTEPLRTLASYRKRTSASGVAKVDFGMNATSSSVGQVAVGDLVIP